MCVCCPVMKYPTQDVFLPHDKVFLGKSPDPPQSRRRMNERMSVINDKK